MFLFSRIQKHPISILPSMLLLMSLAKIASGDSKAESEPSGTSTDPSDSSSP